MNAIYSRLPRIAPVVAFVLGIGLVWIMGSGRSLSYAAAEPTVTLSGERSLGSEMTALASNSLTKTMVSLTGERITHSSPAAADLDGDGDKEIVIGGKDGMLYVIAYSGSSWSVVWSRQVADDLNAASAPGSCAETAKSDIRSAPAIADLDGDGHIEIVVTTGGDPGRSGDPGTPHRNGGVLVYRYSSNSPWSFSVVSGWPQPKLDIVGLGAGASNPDGCWDGIWGSPALGDIDGDGKLEVVVEGFDRRIHAWHWDGSYVSGWPISRDNGDNILRGGWSSPALGDLDEDGLPEVVVGTDSPPWDGLSAPDYTKSTVWAINGDSTNVPGWPATTEQTIQSSLALGDIDGDGQLEVIVGTGSGIAGTGGYKVYAWNANGTLASGWPKSTGRNMPSSPALGDLDDDSLPEVVIGCGTESDSSCNWLYAWNGDGSASAVSGFPVSPPNNSWTGDTAQGLPYPPVLADYTGTAQIETLIVHRSSLGIATVKNNGVSVNDPTLKTAYSLASSPLVDDVDHDGKLEIVIGGAAVGSLDSNGAVYIWDTDKSATAALPWPMFHHDMRRTGRYPLPPKLGFPTEIRLFHQWGSGETETGYQEVRNKGEGNFDWRITNVLTNVRVSPSSSVVTTTTPTQFVITTTGLLTGWHTLGTVQITGTASGQNVLNNPITSTVWVYVGDVSHVYLPVVLRNH